MTFDVVVFRAFWIYHFLASHTIKKDILQLSERAKVSLASVDRATCFNSVGLQVIGAMLLNLSLTRTKKPP